MKKGVNQFELDKINLINKANLHIPINSTFVFISVTVLTFIISTNNQILKDNWLLALQVSLCIPFFIWSNIARSRVVITPSKKIDNFGSWAYTFGIVFFLNGSSILIATLAYQLLGIIFIGTTILLMLSYETLVRPMHYEEIFRIKIKRWVLLFVGFVFLGLLPILGIY